MDWIATISLPKSGSDKHLCLGIKLGSDKETNREHYQNIDASFTGIK